MSFDLHAEVEIKSLGLFLIGWLVAESKEPMKYNAL